jgi:TRAP-type C4-dicarboxylate transport system substrate-binding protein
MRKYLTSLAGTAALILATLTGTAGAEDVLKLRLADSFPSGHFIGRFAVLPFIERVKELSNNTVQFEYYPAQQLGKAKDLLALTQSGVVDIGYVGPSYVSDKMPLSAVAQLPGMFHTSCEGTKAYWSIVKDGQLGKLEFAKNGVVPILAFVLPPYQIFSRDRPLNDVASLAGLKLRSTGGAMDIMTKDLGAVPVRMAAPDVYEALSRGTLDGLIFPWSSILAYNLGNDVKYATNGENFGRFVVTYLMSEAKWKQLPEAARAAIGKAGEEAVTRTCELIDADEAEAIKKIGAMGIQIKELPAAEKEKVNKLLANVSEQWAKNLDDKGRAGTAVLKEFRAALDAQN